MQFLRCKRKGRDNEPKSRRFIGILEGTKGNRFNGSEYFSLQRPYGIAETVRG